MSDSNQVVSDQPIDPAVQPTGDLPTPTNSNDSVQYATYQRVLSEKKRASEEAVQLRKALDEMKFAEDERQKKSLIEQNQWKELYEQEQKKASDALQVAADLKQHQLDAKKLNSILGKLPSQVPNKFWGLINTDNVLVNPDTGEIDDSSILKEVNRIVTEIPEIMTKTSTATVDPRAPVSNGSGTLSKDAWLKLSPSERSKRSADVEGIPDWMVNPSAGFDKAKRY